MIEVATGNGIFRSKKSLPVKNTDFHFTELRGPAQKTVLKNIFTVGLFFSKNFFVLRRISVRSFPSTLVVKIGPMSGNAQNWVPFSVK